MKYKMKYKQRIQVGKRVQDIFALDCVRSIRKSALFGIAVTAIVGGGEEMEAYEGEWLCQKENGEWIIEEGGKS